MGVNQSRYRLDLNDDLVIADEIRAKFLVQDLAFIAQRKVRLSNVWNVLQSELFTQAFLIYWFGETTAFVVVHLKARPNYFIALVLEQNFSHFLASFALFAGKPASKTKTPFGFATNERRNVVKLTLTPQVLLLSSNRIAFINAIEDSTGKRFKNKTWQSNKVSVH